MSRPTTLSSFLRDMQARAAKEISKFQNSGFAKRAMAVCALVASADGNVSPAEEDSVADAITNLEMLKAFDPTDLEPIFRQYCKKAAGGSFAKAELKKVVNGATDEAEKRLLIEIGCIIGGADGNFDTKEINVVRRVAIDLGIDPDKIPELAVK